MPFLGLEGRVVIGQSLDAHVIAEIIAAASPFGTTGATLVDKLRNGVAAMRHRLQPDNRRLEPDRRRCARSARRRGRVRVPARCNRLGVAAGGLRVIERIGAGNEPPYLIDPTVLGVRHRGTVKFDADPYSGFKKNLMTLRVETNALMHIRNANGARRVAAT